MRLAERLIQQQDAAVSSESALRANIPEQGRVLTFSSAPSVDKEADLRITLETASAQIASWKTRAEILLATLVVLTLISGLAKSFLPGPQTLNAVAGR